MNERSPKKNGAKPEPQAKPADSSRRRPALKLVTAPHPTPGEAEGERDVIEEALRNQERKKIG